MADQSGPTAECERKVLVGRTYGILNTTWTEQKDDFDATIERVTGRRGDSKPATATDEIIEVIVIRRTRIVTEVRVESDIPLGAGER